MRIAAKAALVGVLAFPSIPLALAGRAPAATSIGGPPLHEFVFDTGVDPPPGVVEGPDGSIWVGYTGPIHKFTTAGPTPPTRSPVG